MIANLCRRWWYCHGVWYRLRVQRRMQRLQRRLFVLAWRWLGERAYEFRERVLEIDARNDSFRREAEERRRPATFCSECGQELQP